MGTWGPGLYQNDVSADVKFFFKDQLRRGKNCEEITNMLMEQNREELKDPDDAGDFWLALADTQWDWGRLIPMVKDQALRLLSDDAIMDRWRDSPARQFQKRQQILDGLRVKLNTPQPAEKKVSQYRLYQCPWNIGDIFYMPISGEFAEKNGYLGRYLLIEKVAECEWWPGHMIPVVHLRMTKDKNLPDTLEEYKQLDCMQVDCERIEFELLASDPLNSKTFIDGGIHIVPDDDGMLRLPIYRIALITTSKRSIPANLQYWGRCSGTDHLPKEYISDNRDDVCVHFWKELCEVSIKRHLHYLKK